MKMSGRLHARNKKATIPGPILGRRLRKKTRDKLVRCAQDRAACGTTPATSCKRVKNERQKTSDSLVPRAQNKEALVSTPITSGQRAKVRSSRYGVRLWIDPTLKAAFEAASLALSHEALVDPLSLEELAWKAQHTYATLDLGCPSKTRTQTPTVRNLS